MSEENKYLMYIKCDRKCHICEHYKNEILLQQKEQRLISMLEEEKDRLARGCSHIYEDDLSKKRLVNEDIFNEVQKILNFIKENKE